MDDIISRQDAIDHIKAQRERFFTGCTIEEGMEMLIREVPSAQPEIIRCKYCKHGDWYKNAKEEWRCYCLKTEACDMGEDDFCSYAERRTDERHNLQAGSD